MGVTLDLFDPTSIKPGSVIVITARRNSGKTVLLRDLMFHLRKSVDCTVAMTAVAGRSQSWWGRDRARSEAGMEFCGGLVGSTASSSNSCFRSSCTRTVFWVVSMNTDP